MTENDQEDTIKPVVDAGNQNNETPQERRKKKIKLLASGSLNQRKLRTDLRKHSYMWNLEQTKPVSVPSPQTPPKRLNPCPCNQRQLLELMSFPWNFHLNGRVGNKVKQGKGKEEFEPLVNMVLRDNLVRRVEKFILDHKYHFHHRPQIQQVHHELSKKKDVQKAASFLCANENQAAAPQVSMTIPRQQAGTVTGSTTGMSQCQRSGLINRNTLPPPGMMMAHKSAKLGNTPTGNSNQQVAARKNTNAALMLGGNHIIPFSVSLHRAGSCFDLRSIGLVNRPAAPIHVPAVTFVAAPPVVPEMYKPHRLPFLKEGVFLAKNIGKNPVMRPVNQSAKKQ